MKHIEEYVWQFLLLPNFVRHTCNSLDALNNISQPLFPGDNSHSFCHVQSTHMLLGICVIFQWWRKLLQMHFLFIRIFPKSKRLYVFLEPVILEGHWDLKCSSVVILLFSEVETPGCPVCCPVVQRCWAIQKQLRNLTSSSWQSTGSIMTFWQN